MIPSCRSCKGGVGDEAPYEGLFSLYCQNSEEQLNKSMTI